MPPSISSPTSSATARLTRVALLTAMALILFLVESALPRPLPWMRLGLGNAPVLAALLLFGPGAAIIVALAKVLLGGLLSGGLGGPAFVIGGTAACTSVAAMILVRRLCPGLFSPVGVSLAGALTHQVTQLVVAAGYLGHAGLFNLLPMFLVSGVCSGLLTGLATYYALQRLVARDSAA